MRKSSVKVISPVPRDVWANLLEANSDALVTQSPAWLDCICEVGGYVDASRLYLNEKNEYMVLPMVRRVLKPTRFEVLASFPWSWGVGGLLSSGKVDEDDILAVIDDLNLQPALRTSIRPNPLVAEIWEKMPTRPGTALLPRHAHVLELKGGFKYIWEKKFDSNTRRKIRKAERSDLVVEYDTSGRLVPVFYDLFLISLERWASQQHEPVSLARWRGQRRDPLYKIQAIADHLGESCKIWAAWDKEGRPVAAIMILQGRNAQYTRGVMDKKLAAPTYANYLLHKLAIEDACQAGCNYYHMGDSGNSDNTLADFKSHFGAASYPYAEYRIERFPFTRIDLGVRRIVKKVLRFKDI